jgi:hypothetical protein
MTTIIDVGSELLIDRSTVTDPFTRLIVAALGQTVVEGSPWVAIDKQDLGRAYSGNAPQLGRSGSEFPQPLAMAHGLNTSKLAPRG